VSPEPPEGGGPVLTRTVAKLDLKTSTLPRLGPPVQSSYAVRVAAARARLNPGQSFLPFGEPGSEGPQAPEAGEVALAPRPSVPAPSRIPSLPTTDQREPAVPVSTAGGEKGKAHDILAAIRTLKRIEEERREAATDERDILSRFGGFGAVALSIFPDPVLGTFKDPGWQAIGEGLKKLLTAEEYESAKRTTFNAFYTSPTVIRAMFEALSRLGVPHDATVLEPGCGPGRFLTLAPAGMRFIAVELDSISGRIARALHPRHDIRIENFRDTKTPQGTIDAVVGNPPFADIRLDYRGSKLALHDFFIAKGLDALKPGGILAVVTSHFTLDKQNASLREMLADRADFLGAVRLPSDAFKREGTSVVTDLLFLRKRAAGDTANHVDPTWLEVEPLEIDGTPIPINRYFLRHPEQVLGTWSREDRLYDATYSVRSRGDLEDELSTAVGRLPRGELSPAAASPRLEVHVSFRPPAPLPHIAEGSLCIGEGRIICESIGGQAVPVTYGGTLLKADGTMTGRRIASLLQLRDLARRVLQSQNEGWPDHHREEARRDLNRAYDLFVSTYGPINKTTFSTTRDGTVIRRMPNLVRFREDPDAMLVMSLEDYDEATHRARKAVIMTRDVVGPAPEVTSVTSAEEGLLVSLDRRGLTDLAYISRLYGKSEDAIVEELGGLIFFDPETRSWETADQYLSGNVRAKLKVAKAAGPAYERNAEALAQVQPEDILPGEIDANLGAPWIPESDIQAFAADLFGVPPSSVRIGHLKKDAVWSLDCGYAADQSVAATADYGTARANGTSLLEQALNLRTPVIYDVINHGDREERVVNQEQTLAAREKQKLIKERFKVWVFSDAERTERLVRTYNDTYNNLRLRAFDGSHLDFPGMNQTITLRPHQVDAVWRGMSSGNTLLGHVVGSGKTFTMVATALKMRQAGLVKKPMFVVPNHMLEQFAREAQQLYPNARLLIAGKDDLARERRKLLTARIASGDWDGIITTHSSFERIAMSRPYQERFLREQIAEYDALLIEHARGRSDSSRASRNLIKTIEKQKAAREEKLKDLLAEEKKDDGLVFDELGVDHLFVDEAHLFKNLETATKMDRVAGIQTGGSERAFDLYMKCRYLHERHAGHGVTFATGTPISNTMVEMFTMQRFLDPQGLRSRGIEHFDAWAATFGEVVESMEISPDGASLRPRSRFARFVNLPELQQMFRAYSDVQTAEMLDLPRPRLEGGKPQVLACPMSDEQAKLQQELVARYEKLRSQKVDPRLDNALAITTDGRKLALDARMLSATAGDGDGSKVNALIEKVVSIWERTAPSRGTQMVFCDMGVNPTSWGYSAYEEVKEKLRACGIPKDEIADIGDADTDPKKHALLERVRQGSVRVLLGSTTKLGTGVNVQKRLLALHHLDAPWKPAEVEQREGRILRQGNENEEVAIYRYVTQGSFDSYMWQALETKARFIGQIMTGQSAVRKAEDIGSQELSFAEVKAIASGNPAVLTLAEADADLQRLAILKKNHADDQYLARLRLRELPETIGRLTKRLADLTADHKTLTSHADDSLIIGSRPIRPDDALAALGHRLDALPEKVRESSRTSIGRYRGLDFGVVLHPGGAAEVFLEGETTRHGSLSRDHQGPRAVMNALERVAGGYRGQCDAVRRDLDIAEGQLRDHQARLGKPFAHDAYFAELKTLRDQLQAALSGTAEPGEESGPTTSELAERIQEMKASRTIEPAPERRGGTRTRAEAAVTSRLRRRSAPPETDLPSPPPAARPAALPSPPLVAATAPAPDYKLSEISLPRVEVRGTVVRPGSRRPLARAQFRPNGQMTLF
jgi:N12 class adenine-specific DNA methylase